MVEGGKASFTINLSNAYDYDIKIYYETGKAGDTADEGDDYDSGDGGYVIIKAGETSATVEIQTTDDDADEADEEHFTLTLTKAEVNLDDDADVELVLTDKIVDPDGEGCIQDNDDDGGGGGGDPPEHFFDNGHDLSYATFYFATTSGDTRGVYDGDPTGGKDGNLPDGVYTVKIDKFPSGNGGDLDDFYDDILAYVIANDVNVDANTEVLGVAIHAGNGDPETAELFYEIDGDEDSDPYPDPPVDKATGNEVDATIDYSLIFA